MINHSTRNGRRILTVSCMRSGMLGTVVAMSFQDQMQHLGQYVLTDLDIFGRWSARYDGSKHSRESAHNCDILLLTLIIGVFLVLFGAQMFNEQRKQAQNHATRHAYTPVR